MKKIQYIFCAAAMILSLVGCGKTETVKSFPSLTAEEETDSIKSFPSLTIGADEETSAVSENSSRSESENTVQQTEKETEKATAAAAVSAEEPETENSGDLGVLPEDGKDYLSLTSQIIKKYAGAYNGRVFDIAEPDYGNIKKTDASGRETDAWLIAFAYRMDFLQSIFLDGSYWNRHGHIINGQTGYLAVTDTPCEHDYNDDSGFFCQVYMARKGILYDQCLGFAYMLSDMTFGCYADETVFYDYDDLKVGDMARINNRTHSVFILEKHDDYVICAECNADYESCRINWNVRYDRDELEGYYITRY